MLTLHVPVPEAILLTLVALGTILLAAWELRPGRTKA